MPWSLVPRAVASDSGLVRTPFTSISRARPPMRAGVRARPARGDQSMSLRRAVVLAAAGAQISASVAAVALPAQAQPPSDVALTPQAMAANAATDLVASRPAALHASA